MANIEKAIGGVVTTIGHEVKQECGMISHLYTKVESKLQAFARDEPEEMSALHDLLVKSEGFLAAAVPVITERGLNLPADSAAFVALASFLKSFEAAAGLFRGVAESAA